MRQWNDAELLSAYANRQSEEAFGVLVERYVALVYSAALRQVQKSHLAEEVVQATFIILAQKARRLDGRTILSGWLCRTAHFVARNTLKAEFRRHYREQEAHMQSLINESAPEAWRQLAPLLDEAVAQLNEADRSAVVLRFYERKPLNEVGDILGVDPDAAQKRVSRALDKLRKIFARHGVNSTTAAIAENISAHSVQAVPVALAKSVTTVALAKGAAASTSTLTLIKGALKIMAWTKVKTAVVAGAVVLLTAGTTTVIMQRIQQNKGAQWDKGTVPAASPDQASSSMEARQRNADINNLRRIDAAKNQWAFENGKPNGTPVTESDIVPYLGGGKFPKSSAGGTYTIGKVGEKPTCSIPGHELP